MQEVIRVIFKGHCKTNVGLLKDDIKGRHMKELIDKRLIAKCLNTGNG